MSNMPRRSQHGFTIVEFMIATAVFSVILLGVTATILRLSSAYQHSIYSSNTQAATSNLIDTISQAIKFSSGQYTQASVGETFTFCSGTRQFFYVIGRQLGSTNPNTGTRNAVMTRSNTDSTCTPEQIITSTPTGSPSELLGKGMRLSRLAINENSPGLFTITVRVVYGDDDLLCSPTSSMTNSCSSTQTMSKADLSRPDVQCRPSTGSEFCKVSELSTTVYKRL